uniref:Zinc finger, CCHC-type n=1 Tax=Strongyloides papillosus TaxID=174720 RepID=A0A0N5BK26_STREA
MLGHNKLANEDVLSGESEGEPMDHLDIYDSDGYQPSECPDSEDDYPSTDEIATAEPLVNISVQQPMPENATNGFQEMTSSLVYEENKARVKLHTRSIIPKILKNGGLKFREFCHICDSWLTNFSDHYGLAHPKAANESHGDFKQPECFELEAKKKREVARRNKRSTEIRELDGGDVLVNIVSERAIFLDKVRDEVTKNFAVVRDLMATMDSYPEQPHEVKATLKRLGLYDMYNDPIIEEYITYQLNMARRGKGVGNENKPSKELISESNTLKRARPEFLYKAELGNVVQVTYLGTNQTWAAFSYGGKSDISHHMLDEQCRIDVLEPYLEKRKEVVNEHFSSEVLFSIPSKAPLFFNSKGEFWKNNVNQKASAVFLKDTGLDFKKEKVACYKFRIASTTVATYLKFKGITSNDFVDATDALRGHQSKTSERCYDK